MPNTKLTNAGYEDLRRRIEDHMITVPDNKTVSQLTEWFLGYQACLCDIYSIISECEGELHS